MGGDTESKVTDIPWAQKPGCGGGPGLYPACPSSHPFASSPPKAPLKWSVGGAVNNVATRKINCVHAAGLGGAFWGQAGQKRPRLVIFQAGQEMRQAGAQLYGGSEEHGSRSNTEESQFLCYCLTCTVDL